MLIAIHSKMVYVTESIKVPVDEFKAALRALLNAKPEPMAEIPRKRDPLTKKRGPKKPWPKKRS